MNKKRVVILSIVLILMLSLGWIFYYFFVNQDEKTTLTIVEKKWIEKNKNNIVDIGIINNIPVFNYEGDGVFFDFIKNIEKDTGLEFNKISYDKGTESNSSYSFKITNKATDNDIVIYEDNYVIVSKTKKIYNKLEDIPTITVGVTKENLENINFYLYDNKNITYKTFDNEEQLFDEINSESSTVQAIVVPKTLYLDQINTKKLNINYNISDAKINFVLTLGKEKKLNTIIKKYYQKWKTEKYQDSYNKHFLDDYFALNEVYENNIAKFRSKQYKYGFVSYAPFTTLVDNKLVGISSEYLEQFANLTDIEINYKEYKSLHDLIKDFNQNKIDFFLNTSSESKFDMDVYNTISAVNSDISIIVSEKNNLVIKSLSSLKDQTVYVIAGSETANYLKGYGIKTEEVNNLDNVLEKTNENSIIAIDTKAFDIYRYNKLNDYKIAYEFNLIDNYAYTIRDIQANKTFSEFFDFYLSFIDNQKIQNELTHDMYQVNVKNHLLRYLIITTIVILVLFAIIFVITKKPLKKKSKSIVGKDNKIKYIDMLTSLKNRNYLNDAMEKWDDSEIYPQAIIIIDLNNIAYINDNYGHEEGDKVIKEAANILITTQIENSEIMRTNGNEFLVYLVEYDEKQIVTYIKQLTKELKGLSHSFGAAIGYSMITDGLKTLDDAINEATLDMKSNKEEINN